MTIKRLIIRLILFILILILVIPISPVHRIIRSYSIDLLSRSCPSNGGAKYIYNRYNMPFESIPWGIKRRDLKFLISNRLFNLNDFLLPVLSDIIEESENSVSYIINESPQYTVTFYFDSNGKYYKAIEYFKSPYASLGRFFFYNWDWLGVKRILSSCLFRRQYKGSHTYVFKWRCDAYESGFAHYTYRFRGYPLLSPEFKSIDIDGLRMGTTSLAEYPELEISFVMEFEGMVIEHNIRLDPDDPSQFLREAVYTSTFLTGD